MINITLSDSSSTATLAALEVPLSIDTIENATDVQTLDFNIYTDFINQKRQWSHTWSSLTEAEYNILRGFYDRQFTDYQYPDLSIDYYGVSDIPVRMTLNTKEVIDNCGTISNVQVTFRETDPLPGGSS